MVDAVTNDEIGRQKSEEDAIVDGVVATQNFHGLLRVRKSEGFHRHKTTK